MNNSSVTLAKILTYSGTLPLLASLVFVYFPITGVDGNFVFKTYSAIIISFLCGIHWAVYLFYSEKCPRHLLLASNAVALLAWCSLLLMHRPEATLLQSLCFIYLLTLDLKLRDAGILPEWFFALRRNASIIVVVCLAGVALLS